jgi:ArsR family transcriptional regulator
VTTTAAKTERPQSCVSGDQAAELEQVFKAVADRHRVRILNRRVRASGEPVCVCDFEELLGLKQPTVSYHLTQLLNAGLVTRERRDGSRSRAHSAPTHYAFTRRTLAH